MLFHSIFDYMIFVINDRKKNTERITSFLNLFTLIHIFVIMVKTCLASAAIFRKLFSVLPSINDSVSQLNFTLFTISTFLYMYLQLIFGISRMDLQHCVQQPRMDMEKQLKSFCLKEHMLMLLIRFVEFLSQAGTALQAPGQSRDSIIGPWAKQCTVALTYTTTHRNKTVNVDKIKHIIIVLVLPTKSVFKH